MSEDKPRLPKLEMPKLSQEFLDGVAAAMEAAGKACRQVSNAISTTGQSVHKRPKPYQCHKCGERLADYEVFESGWPNKIRHWCMNHIPLRSRIRLWWQERGSW